MSQATLYSSPYRNSDLFSGYYLDERIDDLEDWDCYEEAEAAFEELQDLWELEGDLLASYNEDELLDSWIDEVLSTLGFDTLSETTLPGSGGYNDRLLFDSDEERRDAARQKRDGNVEAMYNLSSAVLEAKQWGADFSKRFSEQRSYRDASHQIKYYLEHTPEHVDWGILTDGKKWRLYGTKDYATETYYEVDLEELLVQGDVEEFKYFYAFFRPEAFREVAGTSFLETVWSESETAAQELGEDLQDNVFTALRVLGEGFVESNDLGIDPADDEAREELKEQSLVLLYRLMFVFYAESRGLIHPNDPDAESDYRENFSLEEMRDDVVNRVDEGETFDDFSEYSTQMWGRLQDLFRLIDTGEDALGIPAYNGGLFDHDDHAFLAKNDVADRYVAEVIYRLGTTENEEGEDVTADYADLDTRHLGTIYEGLLEHEFRIAPEQYAAVEEDGGQVWKPATEVSVADAVETVREGELYVVNDDGERKATGAYYTPDYVVSYIVEETVDPLLDEIRDDLEADGLQPSDEAYFGRFYSAVQDLKILDPAMGSGHFLTKATGYLTEQVMEVVREQERMGRDEQQLRRTISRECIYGVDINGMATELAKLSMWLETLATDQPLAFLDHHLKAGNSLVGSDITDVLATSDSNGTEQATLFDDFSRTRRQALEHVMGLLQDLLDIENETVADAKAMEELYEEIRSDDLYERLFSIANVHTAERFGLDLPTERDVYKDLADAIDDDEKWGEIEGRDWYQTAQVMANNEQFFHWELEYPEVFFSEEGERGNDAGFDAVVGNPPYVRIHNLRDSAPKFVDYAIETYESSSGRFDIYSLFVEKGEAIASESRLCYILPNKFFKSDGGKELRKHLIDTNTLNKVLDFGDFQVFSGATTYTCILLLTDESTHVRYGKALEHTGSVEYLKSQDFSKIPLKELNVDNWSLSGPYERAALQKMRETGKTLGELSNYLSEGIVSGDNDVLFGDVTAVDDDVVAFQSEEAQREYRLEAELVHPLITGDDIERYTVPESELGVIYPYEIQDGTHTLLGEERLEKEYPQTYQYLLEFEDRLTERGTGSMRYNSWYALYRSREKQIFESPKIITPDICQRCEFAVDRSGGEYLPDTAYGIVPKKNNPGTRAYLLAVLNSSSTWFYIYHTSSVLRGDFRRFKTSFLTPLPIPNVELPDEVPEVDFGNLSFHREEVAGETRAKKLASLAEVELGLHERLNSLNLSLLDHLGTYDDGETLADIGFTQPPENAADSILQETSEQKPNLRVGDAAVVRESSSTVEIRLTARYKPDNEEGHETDQWGYTETDPLPALRITDLSETEADLIEAFVPVAVEEAGGFAGFRETATKTNSLVDRLRGLTLPDVNDVEQGLESYLETKERADELEEKIERTDDLIDEIVYELYGLTEEEIEIVEEAVGE